MRRFVIVSHDDKRTDRTHTGLVAEGVEFADGQACTHSPTTHKSLAWPSVSAARDAYMRAGSVELVWLDHPGRSR